MQAAAENAALFLTGRIVTVLLGAATIAVVFALGNQLFGRRAGFVAALLYAVAPLAVVHAHFLTVDVPATFFVALALLWAARLLVSQTWKDYGFAALFTGLAAATKYNAGLVIVAPIAAHFLNKIPGTCNKHRNAQFVVLLAVSLLTFLIACPGPWLNFSAFWDGIPNYPGSGVYYELFQHSREGHGELFLNTGPGWWYHIMHSLHPGLGMLFWLAIAGLVFACVRRTRQDWVLLTFLLIYFVATSLSAVRFARYMLPLFPVLCVFAARLLTQPFPKTTVVRAWAGVGAVVFLFTAGMTTLYVRAMASPDPRDMLADYLDKTAPQGATIAFAKVPWFFSPPLSPLFGAPSPGTRAHAAERTTRYQLRIPATEWDSSVLTPLPDYTVLSDFEWLNAVTRLHIPAAVQFYNGIAGNAGIHGQYFVSPAVPLELKERLSMTNLPEDLRYALPTLLLLQQK